MTNLTVARLVQLLGLDSIPVPGDRVRIKNSAKKKSIHGCVGRIDRITNINVVLDDGRTVNVTPQSVEVLPYSTEPAIPC